MLKLFEQRQVYFARDPIDMRTQIDGLALQVQEGLELNSLAPRRLRFVIASARQRQNLILVQQGMLPVV